MFYPTCQNYGLLTRNLWSGWKMSFNDSNLSVCKPPTSIVPVAKWPLSVCLCDSYLTPVCLWPLSICLCVSALGLLSLEEFRSLDSNAFQRFLQQRGVKSSQLVRNSRHTWLYQGKGAHQVLRDLKKRWGEHHCQMLSWPHSLASALVSLSLLSLIYSLYYVTIPNVLMTDSFVWKE